MIRRSYLAFFNIIHLSYLIPAFEGTELGVIIILRLMDWLLAVPGPLDYDIMVILLCVCFGMFTGTHYSHMPKTTRRVRIESESLSLLMMDGRLDVWNLDGSNVAKASLSLCPLLETFRVFLSWQPQQHSLLARLLARLWW